MPSAFPENDGENLSTGQNVMGKQNKVGAVLHFLLVWLVD
jgi:hypothetical protein